MLLAKFDLKEYARRGAEARVMELQAELADIYRAFPGLRLRRGTTAGGARAESEPVARRRRASTMTAEQRKAVSARMKKYWAERRKTKSAK
jgi:hypothetical protein